MSPRFGRRDEIIMQAVAADTFAGDLVGVMKFFRDDFKRLTSFTVKTTGVRRAAFQSCRGRIQHDSVNKGMPRKLRPNCVFLAGSREF